jgi:hypothetical protein
VTCFNCGKVGHINCDCAESKRVISQPTQNKNSPAVSGANNTSLGDRRNYLKQQLLTVENGEISNNSIGARGVQIANVADFFKNLKLENNEVINESKSVGKIIVVEIEVQEKRRRR